MIHIPKKGNYFHVTHNNTSGKWHVKEVKDNEIKTFSSKEEAIKEAAKLSKKSLMGHVVVHNEMGKFETFENF